MRKKLKKLLNNEHNRKVWLKKQLEQIDAGHSILDAGCGKQQYKKYCNHLKYSGQDFGKYETDEKDSFAAGIKPYNYGKLDYVGNIWDIDELDSTFDAILCSEVLEHIPYPFETLKEFHRLLKPGGKLILTFPSNCLRHQDPYYFSSGYSDRWIEYFLPKLGFDIVEINPVGDYYKWLMVEVYRTWRTNPGLISSLLLLPSFIYYYFKQRKPSKASINTLCMGYHVLATKNQ